MALEISAILPTYNRAHYLPLVLDALSKQTLPRDQFEIIVVNDGSTDNTLEVLASHGQDLPLKVFTLRHCGIATAKNVGIFASSAPIVVFLDDDDVLHPDALRTHLLAHQSHPNPNQAVLGYTSLAPEVSSSPVMDYVVNKAGSLFCYSGLSSSNTYGWREFWGGRSSCKRAFLLEHAMFTPEFRFGYEDIECGWRLDRHGLEVFYEPAAHSTMVRAITFDGFCDRSYRQGLAARHFYRLHPVPMISEYLRVKETITIWNKYWRDYSRIFRTAFTADRNASRRGANLSEMEIARLHGLYHDAFRLSFAKGFDDAGSFASEARPPKSVGYGLQAVA
ncbi:hypothetical protein K32_08490 [Kaistia sp. 32K]|uniref:glycosyltransferase family 2 protein n=1 Tax=Kaistia sp. 32K TaxID=2795690 RepID=UPI001915A7D3|nr:glycosyltransferase family 2 protein [Kaistia sp. 32K]BCP52232.1 hypothetical protein K32_08490 [Kaistia sp. 32K]